MLTVRQRHNRQGQRERKKPMELRARILRGVQQHRGSRPGAVFSGPAIRERKHIVVSRIAGREFRVSGTAASILQNSIQSVPADENRADIVKVNSLPVGQHVENRSKRFIPLQQTRLYSVIIQNL